MSIEITYNGDTLVNETDSCVKILKTAGTRMQDDITVDYESDAKTLTTKSIIANGTYNASSDNADGYSSVTVNCPDRAAQVLDCSITGTITVPEGVTIIRRDFFKGCTLLESAIFPSTLEQLQDGAFSGCSSLKTAAMPNNMTTIGSGVFMNCGFESYQFPEIAPTVGGSFLKGCIYLKDTNIPNVTKINNEAFSGCRSMEQFDCTALTVTNGNVDTVLNHTNAFNNTGTSTFLFATQEIMNVYAAATNWSTFASRMTYVGAE